MVERNQLRLIQEQQKHLLQQHQAGGALSNMSASNRLTSLLNRPLQTEMNSNGELHIVPGSLRETMNHSDAPDKNHDSSMTTS